MDSFYCPNTVCATQASTSTVMTTNQSVEYQQDAADVDELPLLWSLVGCGALSLLKILFSLITVVVNTVLVSYNAGQS